MFVFTRTMCSYKLRNFIKEQDTHKVSLDGKSEAHEDLKLIKIRLKDDIFIMYEDSLKLLWRPYHRWVWHWHLHPPPQSIWSLLRWQSSVDTKPHQEDKRNCQNILIFQSSQLIWNSNWERLIFSFHETVFSWIDQESWSVVFWRNKKLWCISKWRRMPFCGTRTHDETPLWGNKDHQMAGRTSWCWCGNISNLIVPKSKDVLSSVQLTGREDWQ